MNASFGWGIKQHLDNMRRKDSLRGAETTAVSVRLGNYSASYFEGSAISRVGHQVLPRHRGHLHATVAFLREALREILIFVDTHLRNQGTQRRVPDALSGEAGRRNRAIVE